MPNLRLEPRDEYTHPPDDVVDFNESVYANACDPATGLGGFFRIGNRPNEGYAEVTACLYLPDRRVAFAFGRAPIASNDAFAAAGMRFEVVRPFVELAVTFDREVAVLSDPLAMEDPKAALAASPRAGCSVRLSLRGISPMFGGEPAGEGHAAIIGSHFARAHFEQHVQTVGEVSVGADRWPLDGFGLRDHSWGPRSWQAPHWYRWLTGNFGDDAGFMLLVVGSREGRTSIDGVVLSEGRYHPVEEISLRTEWTSEALYHSKIEASARTRERTYLISGVVQSLIPLRNRRTAPDGARLVTRISEGLTRWHCDGRVGHGMSEYLDQIVDGRPVGAVAEPIGGRV